MKYIYIYIIRKRNKDKINTYNNIFVANVE